MRDALRRPEQIKYRIGEAVVVNGAFLATEEARSELPVPQVKMFIDAMFWQDIVHVMWNDRSNKTGDSTMLPKGETTFFDIYFKRRPFEV